MQDIVARRQASEFIEAVGVADPSRHQGIAIVRVKQADGDTAQTGLTLILDAVTIRVVPNEVGNAGRAHTLDIEAGVDGRVGSAPAMVTLTLPSLGDASLSKLSCKLPAPALTGLRR